jgi:MFS family permease
MSVGMIFNKIKDIKFNWARFKFTQFAIRRLLKLTKTIIDATNLPEFKEFTGKVIYDKLDKFTTTLKKLCSVYEVLGDSYASILLFGTFYKKVKNSLLLLLKLAQTAKLLSSIQLPNKIEQLDIIESIVEKIASIQKNISFSIKFFIVGWLAFRLIRRFIKKLPDLIRDINILCAKVAGINVVDNGIKNVNKIITAITDIQKNVILSALLFIPASIGLLCMIGFTYLLILFVNVISKMAKGDSFTKVINIASKNILNITKIIMALVIVAYSILAFTIIALVLSEIIKYTLVPTILLLIGTIIFIFVAMLFAWGISKLTEKISKNVAINIIMITGCFIIAALAILVAAVVGEKFRSGEVWANLGIGISVIILVSTAMVGLGIALSFAAPFMAMATAGMTPLLVALGMMLAAGLTIVAIGAMSFDFGKFEKGTNPKEGQFGKGTKSAGNLGLLFEFVQFLVAQIGSGYSRKDKKTVKKANKVLKRVKTTVKTILFIGEQLNTLQKLTFNADVITANVKNIFSFVGNLETKITEFLNPKSNVFGKTTIKNIISAAKSKRKQWKKSGKALSRVEKTIAVISDIATTLLTLKDFNFDEDKKDKNGILKKGTKATILNNIETLLSTVTEISDKINNAENLKSINDNTNSKVLTFTSYINTINDSLKAIADLDPTVSKTYVDNYIRFIDKVNTIDVEKAQKTTQLFEQMAKFSASIKGDFDKLAEALNEKMLPVLEELKDIMGKVPEKLDTGFANTSASISAANAPATVENVAAQLNRENPDKDKNFIEKLLDKRMAEKAQQEANSTTAKLDELITLLKGFGPQVAVVKTL